MSPIRHGLKAQHIIPVQAMFCRRLQVSPYNVKLHIRKVFRKVYKDCQLSYNGNSYRVPYRACGKKVMLKIKKQIIRIYLDQDLLATYTEPQGKGHSIGDPRIYEELRKDREQATRKYGQAKGKATLGLVNASLLM